MQTYAEIDIQEIPLSSPIFRKRVETFLTANGLRFEEVDSYYALLDKDGEIVAGAGLLNDVVKCVAVDSDARSGGLLAPLLSYIISHASAQGISNLKVFSKPENEGIFRSLGFHLIASAPKAILMENGHGLENYLRSLTAAGSAAGLRPYSAAAQRGWTRPGSDGSPATGVIVMNANPFTLGHQYLVRKAAESVDRLFVIPVMHDIPASFPYEERLAMINAGCGDLATVLEGSAYQISDITFPTYFLKDLSDASETQIRLDLDLFGRYIAPALGATVRFVGSEPSDPLTARYNELMKDILPQYGITVVEVPRLTADYTGLPSEPGRVHPRFAAAEYGLSPTADPVTASSVREHLEAGCFFEAAKLTPATTWPYLVAELMARALLMELEAPFKPGLVDPTSNGAHSDMDYALMKGSIEVIRRSFARYSEYAHYQSVNDICLDQSDEANVDKELIFNNLQITPSPLSSFGKAIEADVMAFTAGVNTYRGAIFSLGLVSVAALDFVGGGQVVDYQLDKQNDPSESGGVKKPNIFIDNGLGTTATCRDGLWFTSEELSEAVSRLAKSIKPSEDSHGAKAVNEYGVKGALQMAREGYKPLFEDWLPFYRSMAVVPSEPGRVHPRCAAAEYGLSPAASTADATNTWRLQKTLLRIISQLDDTCVIHRAGYERACEVKMEAKRLLENFTPEGLKEMKERYDWEGISPGGAADMLALTILVDSLLS